jgi:predicted dienelactone hydrolase
VVSDNRIVLWGNNKKRESLGRLGRRIDFRACEKAHLRRLAQEATLPEQFIAFRLDLGGEISNVGIRPAHKSFLHNRGKPAKPDPAADRMEGTHQMKKFSRLLRGILIPAFAMLVASCGGSSNLEPIPFTPPDQLGSYAVGHTVDVVTDASRDNRQLPIDIWYPAVPNGDVEFTIYPLQGDTGITSEIAYRDAQPNPAREWPMLVFSHGFGGINTQSLPLMEYLASRGFVVVAPEHTGNTNGDTSSTDPGGDRAPDISAVIDFMNARCTDTEDPFHNVVNTKEVGVMGHSFGGFTATAVATGFRNQTPDPRVVAIMPIAAANRAITDEELSRLTIPALFLCGTLDPLLAQQERTLALASSDVLFGVSVVGATHTHFANICQIGNWLISIGLTKETWPSIGASALTGPYEATCEPPALDIEIALRAQNLYAGAFFGRYLLGNKEYDPYLTEEYATENEPGVIFFSNQ